MNEKLGLDGKSNLNNGLCASLLHQPVAQRGLSNFLLSSNVNVYTIRVK
jgi:hypothetical protein